MNIVQWSAALDSTLWIRLTLALLHFLWLGCAIALLAAIAGRLLRRASAQTRYLANVCGLFAMAACLPAAFVLTPVPQAELPRATASAEPVTRLAELRVPLDVPAVPEPPAEVVS